MTERLLGEGIHNAIETGQAAARAIVAAAGEQSKAQEQFHRDLQTVQLDLQACAMAAKLFYDLKFLGLAGLFPIPRHRALIRGFAAGMTFREIMRNCLVSSAYSIEPVPAVREFEQSAANA